MNNVLIVGGGPISLSQLKSELTDKPDLIIAADRGGKYLNKLTVFPHILIGDFDSLPGPLLKQMIAAGVEIKPFAVKKDFTDLELALDIALQRDATQIRILGGLGRRIDHTLGNIGLLIRTLDQGIETHLLDSNHDIMATFSKLSLKKKPGWFVSLIPLTLKVSGVTTTGLAYKLDKADLLIQSTRGIHNEFSEETATVEVAEGVLLVICFRGH